MVEESDSSRLPRETRESPLFRWVQGMQWFGVVMLLMAVGLASFTDLTASTGDVPVITAFGVLGVVSLVAARCLLTLCLKYAGSKAGKKPPAGQP